MISFRAKKKMCIRETLGRNNNCFADARRARKLKEFVVCVRNQSFSVVLFKCEKLDVFQ